MRPQSSWPFRVSGHPRSVYTYHINEDVLVILDQNTGGRSVTNDADEVIKELAQSGNIKPTTKVIYRDTDGNFDEMQHNGTHFAGFRSLGGVTFEDDAVRVVKLK